MTTLAEQKADLRKQSLNRRNDLDPAHRIEMSLQAAEHAAKIDIFQTDSFTPGTTVAGFHPIRSEIDPRPTMFHLMAMGARLCLPVVTDATTIEFRELVRGSPLVESGFGTIGPDENAAVLDPEIILVPLSVYDKKGGRIGYGAGFYDRAIERLAKAGREPQLLGMAFSVQETHTVPMEKHDRYLSGIITEAGYILARS